MTLGQKLRILREAKGYSQEDMAAAINKRYKGANFDRYQFANWETDRHMPKWYEAKLLVRYFKITLDDLFFEERKEFLKEATGSTLKKVA